jgi:plastocyanin
MAMRRVLTSGAGLVLLASACFGGGAATRTVLVDYASDQFAGAFLNYFPKNVEVRQGDTVVFRQSWSGEAHSVTMGTLVDKYGGLIEKDGYFKLFEQKGYEGLPPDTPKDIKPLEDQLTEMFAPPDYNKAAQNGAQPCYLSSGRPPKSPDTPCTKAQQVQPEFTGRQSYYNSGYIHYAGANGNTFRVRIANDASPGRYFFYCNNHGPFMSGWLTIKKKGSSIPSETAVNRAALNEASKVLKPLGTVFQQAKADRFPVPTDQINDIKAAGLPTAVEGGKVVYKGRWGGFGAEHVDTAVGLEFIPKTSTVKVGQKVSWLLIGPPHTVSFDVPKYFPIFTVKPDGTVERNPKLDPPAGGSPKPGDQKNGVLSVDGGTWDGSHFFSSGTIGADKFAVYSLRFSKPGTYKYACLVHPSMVGTITVTS